VRQAAIITSGATVPESRILQATEPWLGEIERHARAIAPDLGDVLNDYIGEARFGAAIIDAEMCHLPQGSRVLEIGAGMLLLSCALQSAGYQGLSGRASWHRLFAHEPAA
jgi:hypothetical protein